MKWLASQPWHITTTITKSKVKQVYCHQEVCKEEMAGLYFSAMTAKEAPKYTETDKSFYHRHRHRHPHRKHHRPNTRRRIKVLTFHLQTLHFSFICTISPPPKCTEMDLEVRSPHPSSANSYFFSPTNSYFSTYQLLTIPSRHNIIFSSSIRIHSNIKSPSGNFGGSLPLHYYNYLAEDMANCEATVINVIIIIIIFNIITVNIQIFSFQDLNLQMSRLSSQLHLRTHPTPS